MKTKPLSAFSLGYARADKRIEILHLVGLHGSISQASRSAGVSYKAAWQAVHTLTNLAGEPLVDSSVGGSGGGGARLTPAGARLLEAAGQMDAARRDVLDRINSPSIGVLTGPRTSMRNHLPCVVARLESAGARDPMVRAVVALPGGHELTSFVTRESIELLELKPGQPILALCKATAVRIEPGDSDVPDASGESGNCLPGRVLRVARGTSTDELVLTLASGQQLVGFAARPNRLRAGSKAQAHVEGSAVVLALA
ncbi:TOBE domain-containing protein [Ottowia thiooxydans]|uniref:TOBE domain-containing protein n=1 Tax=Ottowia thiooxydans TaxID=219182 RepID=UPI00041607C7|nr:TOBE domain-containing protein [Ottowia thiooxydans]